MDRWRRVSFWVVVQGRVRIGGWRGCWVGLGSRRFREEGQTKERTDEKADRVLFPSFTVLFLLSFPGRRFPRFWILQVRFFFFFFKPHIHPALISETEPETNADRLSVFLSLSFESRSTRPLEQTQMAGRSPRGRRRSTQPID